MSKIDITIMPKGEEYLDQRWVDWVRRVKYQAKSIRTRLFDLFLHPEYDPDKHQIDLAATRKLQNIWNWYRLPMGKVYHVHPLPFTTFLDSDRWWHKEIGACGAGIVGPSMELWSLRRVTEDCAAWAKAHNHPLLSENEKNGLCKA